LLGCLDDQAELMRAVDAAADAVRVFASVEVARERLTLRRYPRLQRRWSETIAEVRRHLGNVKFEQAWSEGRALSIDDAISHAYSRVERDAAQAETLRII
jgi:hypothetical protein